MMSHFDYCQCLLSIFPCRPREIFIDINNDNVI